MKFTAYFVSFSYFAGGSKHQPALPALPGRPGVGPAQDGVGPERQPGAHADTGSGHSPDNLTRMLPQEKQQEERLIQP